METDEVYAQMTLQPLSPVLHLNYEFFGILTNFLSDVKFLL